MMSPTLPTHAFGPMYPAPSHWSNSPSSLRADSATYSPSASYRQMSPSIATRTLPMYSESYQHQHQHQHHHHQQQQQQLQHQHQQQQHQQQQYAQQSTPKRSVYPSRLTAVASSKAYQSEQHDDVDRLVTDMYMESHSVSNGEESDNLFDFVLLPGVMNARRGMKVAAPETIPCKYGHTCFRRDCRFAHGSIDETTGLAPRGTSPTRASAPTSHHAHRSSFSSSRARSPSSGYSTSSNENSPTSEPSTPPRFPIMRDFAISL